MRERSSTSLLRVMAVAIALGGLGDALLRVGPWGANFPAWTLAVLAAAWTLAAYYGTEWRASARWLMLPVLAFSLGFAWRDSAGLKLLDLFALLVALALWSLSVEGVRIRSLRLADYIRAALGLLLAAATGAPAAGRIEIARGVAPRPASVRRARSAALGLAISLPLLFLFGGLLMGADPVFDRAVTRAFDVDLASFFSHGALTVFFAWVVFGFLLLILRLMPPLRDLPEIDRPRLGLLEVGLPIALLDALFLAFVVIQLRYLFGDETLVRATTGLTYAEYARRGFFELVTVAALVLPLLLLADWVLAESSRGTLRVFRALAGVQLLLLSVIMASAIKRMLLYQSAYGLTELRVYTTAFMGWIGVVLLWFGLTVLRGRRRAFATGAAVAGLLIVGVLNVVNPDRTIARVNVERALAGSDLDIVYVTSLSGDAVPPLLSALTRLEPDDRCTLAARLLERWATAGGSDWRSWNYGRARARRAVGEALPKLRETACAVPAGGGEEGAPDAA